jgi:RNA polymerase sigma-70 factor (ECF subfamily)
VNPFVAVEAEVDEPAGPPVVDRFDLAFNAHYVGLVRLAMAFGATSVEAEDAVQDTFISFGRRIDDVTPGAELAYLQRSTVNACIGRHRRARPHLFRVLDHEHESIPTPDAIDSISAQATVRAAVRRLPTRQRACVILRYFADLPDAAIADVLGISVGSVKTHLSRARSALRLALGDDHDLG